MAIFFIDSMAHYTTAAQGETKVAVEPTAPIAATGAFGAPGTKFAAGGRRVNFTATATLELSAYVKLASVSGDGLLVAWNTTAGRQASLYCRTDGTVELYRNDIGGGTKVSNSASSAVVFGVQHHLYVRIVISATVGTILVMIDGTDIAMSPATGLNNQQQAASTITGVILSGYGLLNEASCIWSHLALASVSGDITGQPRVEAVFPDGAGNYSAWTPTAGLNYTNVDETTPNDDTDYVSSSTVAQRDSYLYSNLLPSAQTILAVALVPRIRKDDALVRTVKRFVRAGGVDYDGVAVAVPATYAYVQEVLPTNPATGVAWTVAEVNALEAGIKVES